MAGESEAIVYEEAVRGIQRQQTVIDDLRSRTGSLFGAAVFGDSFPWGAGSYARSKSGLDRLGSHLRLCGGLRFLSHNSVALEVSLILDPTILMEDHLEKTVGKLRLYLAEIEFVHPSGPRRRDHRTAAPVD